MMIKIYGGCLPQETWILSKDPIYDIEAGLKIYIPKAAIKRFFRIKPTITVGRGIDTIKGLALQE